MEGSSRQAAFAGVRGADPAAIQLLTFHQVPDRRGNLTPVEGGRDIPFAIRRVYWIYDVPGGAARGGFVGQIRRHLARSGPSFLPYLGVNFGLPDLMRPLAPLTRRLSGSFDLTLDDGRGSTVRQTLNRSYYGLYVPSLTWRRLENFSTNGVCLVLASQPYDESD